MSKKYPDWKVSEVIDKIKDMAKCSYIGQPRPVSVHSMPELRRYDTRVWITLKNRLVRLPEGTAEEVFAYINDLPQEISSVQDRHAKDIDLMYAMLAKNANLNYMSAVPCNITVVDEKPLTFSVQLVYASQDKCVPCTTIGPVEPDMLVKNIEFITKIYKESQEMTDFKDDHPLGSPEKCPQCGKMSVFHGFFPYRHCGRCGSTFRYRSDTVLETSTAMEFCHRYSNAFKELPSHRRSVLTNPGKVAQFMEWVRAFDGKVVVKFVSPREDDSVMIAFFYNNGKCRDGNYMEEVLDGLFRDAGFRYDAYDRSADTGNQSLLLIRTVEKCTPDLDDDTQYGKYTSYGVAVDNGEITPLTREQMYMIYDDPPKKNETFGHLPKALREARERRKEVRKKADFNRRFEN